MEVFSSPNNQQMSFSSRIITNSCSAPICNLSQFEISGPICNILCPDSQSPSQFEISFPQIEMLALICNIFALI